MAAAGDMKSIDVSDCCIYEVSAELLQHLHRFPALQHVNISGNPLIGSAGVAAMISSLAGAYQCALLVLNEVLCDGSCRQHQEHRY